MSGDDFPSFGTDPIREMRDRINRDRDAFFGDDIGGPRRPRWSQESPGPFFRDPAGLYDFPAPSSPGFRSRFTIPNFPTDFDDGFRNSSFEQPPQDAVPRHTETGTQDNKPIPIRVIHEHTQTPKNRMTSSRNTTEIPARPIQPQPDIQAEKSPRLERAHSEPPKLFNQRMRSGGASSPASHAYSTIPENSETPAPSVGPRAHLFDADSPNHKLSSSASAPSVPNTNNTNRPSNVAPVAPPRRSSAAANAMQANKPEKAEEKPSQPPQPPPSQTDAPKVRHIPIFVEGRDEPVNPRKSSQPETPGSPFKQPSEFYPPNVQKVRSQSVASPGVGSGGGIGRGLNLKPQQPSNPLEPTSPLSPPPSNMPIPMGYTPHTDQVQPQPQKEPTSPIAPPPGPIPMPFKSDVVDGPAEVHHVPVKVVEAPEPPKPECDPPPQPSPAKKISPAEEKLRKIESEVSELLQRVEKFNGCRKDKEYLFLDDLLTQKMCLLDSIESEGREDIRKMRKDSIKTINRCLSMLDRRATKATSAGTPPSDGDKSCDAAQVSEEVLSDLVASQSDAKESPVNEKQ